MLGRSYNRVIPLILMAIALCLLSSACASNQMKIVQQSKLSYDIVTDTVIDLDKQGLIDREAYNTIEKYADIYADLHNAAIEVIKAYKNGAATGDDVSATMTAISKALTELLIAAGPYIVEGG